MSEEIGQTRWYIAGSQVLAVRDVFEGEPYVKGKFVRCECASYDGKDFSWTECPEGADFSGMKVLAIAEQAHVDPDIRTLEQRKRDADAGQDAA